MMDLLNRTITNPSHDQGNALQFTPNTEIHIRHYHRGREKKNGIDCEPLTPGGKSPFESLGVIHHTHYKKL